MKDPVPQFKYITEELKKLDLAYVHYAQRRTSGGVADAEFSDEGVTELGPLIEAWGTEIPFIVTGGYNAEKAEWTINNVAKAHTLCWSLFLSQLTISLLRASEVTTQRTIMQLFYHGDQLI